MALDKLGISKSFQQGEDGEFKERTYDENVANILQEMKIELKLIRIILMNMADMQLETGDTE